MVDDRTARHNKMREEWAELKSAALAKLERHGYDVRGKTPAQIRQNTYAAPIEANIQRPRRPSKSVARRTRGAALLICIKSLAYVGNGSHSANARHRN
jgi:hypothetical protein